MWQRYSYKNARGHHDPGRLRFLKPVIQLITTLLRLSEQHCGLVRAFFCLAFACVAKVFHSPLVSIEIVY